MQLLKDLPVVLQKGALHVARLDGEELVKWGHEDRGWMHLAVVLSVTLFVLRVLQTTSKQEYSF